MRWQGFVAGLFSGVILLTPISESKTRKKPQSAPLITEVEKLCTQWGKLAWGIATDRDQGISLVTTIGSIRKVFINQEKSITDMAVFLAYAIYTNHAYPATRAQQDFEVGCLKHEYTMLPMHKPLY